MFIENTTDWKIMYSVNCQLNGCFSVASKKIADRTTMFIDSTLKERKDNQNNDSI